MMAKCTLCLSFLFFLGFVLTVNSKRLPNRSHRTIGRFDSGDVDYSPEEEVTTKKTALLTTAHVKDTGGSGSKNLLTPAQTTNLLGNILGEVIDLITTGIRNISINDIIAIGVFVVAIVGIKIVVIGILVGIWVGVEKYGEKGGYEESSGYGYGSPPQMSYGSPQVAYGAPSVSYGNPSTTYGKPSTNYGTPAIAYGTPSNSYGAPAAAYGTPTNTYGTPSNTYGTPSNTYGTPGPVYGPPSTNYGTPVATGYSSSISSSRKSSTNDFEQIAEWLLNSVTKYILSLNNKSVNQT